MYKIANIDKFGRVSIPKKMRKMLGLDESSTVYIEDRNHELETVGKVPFRSIPTLLFKL